MKKIEFMLKKREVINIEQKCHIIEEIIEESTEKSELFQKKSHQQNMLLIRL